MVYLGNVYMEFDTALIPGNIRMNLQGPKYIILFFFKCKKCHKLKIKHLLDGGN
jgi:hypothetical protein